MRVFDLDAISAMLETAMSELRDMERQLDELVKQNYYSEQYELEGVIRRFVGGLDPHGLDLFKRVVTARIGRDPSIVNIILCGVTDMPETVPVLITVLNTQTATSQVTRTLMHILEKYPGDETYMAVARFLESEQEGEAMACLARMDYSRTLSRLRIALRRDPLSDVCLHIFAERRKSVGLPAFIEEMKVLCTGAGGLRERVRKAFLSKTGRFSPFAPEDIVEILAALEGVN